MKGKQIFFFLLILLFISCNVKVKVEDESSSQKDVLGLRCEPIDTVRVAFIGLGMRGSDAVRRFMYLDGVEVVALCDVRQEKVSYCQQILKDNQRAAAKEYYGENDWKKVCELEQVDLVYVCTQWDLHTPIAVAAMDNGKHVALEVPAAMTIDECWDLVNAAERNQRHCIMLENCCYDFFEMATLNMAQKGLFGEVVHAEGAYIHDLRWLCFDDTTGYWNDWRLKYNTTHTGNPYPTHGLGPIAQILNIHRGDRMDFLVSISSEQFGLTEYAENQYGKTDEKSKTAYELGDMNTTIIKTAKGKTMMIQHNITSPRPYSRIHAVCGTKGFAQKYPVEQLAFDPNAHTPLADNVKDSLLKVYEHPFSQEIGEIARKVGGHGGMDFIMDYRLIYCLHKGLPLDMDVYDAAEWSSIVELSEKSARDGGVPVQIPDFTRGKWDKLNGLKFYD